MTFFLLLFSFLVGLNGIPLVNGFGCCWFRTLTDDQAFFPLRSVVINATVVNAIVKVSIEHEFETTHPLFEISRVTTYELPIDSNGAVTSFRAFIGTRTIEGVVKSKEDAKQDFDKAVEEGRPAFLAESTTTAFGNSDSVFQLSLGNVPQNDLLRVELTYVAPIQTVSSELFRLVLPASLAPEVEPWSPLSRLPFRNNGATINVQVMATPSIISITSPTHVIDNNNNQTTEALMSARLVDQEFKSRRDIVFEFTTLANPGTLQVYAEQRQPSLSNAMMMTIVPFINATTNDIIHELVFVIDRSRSVPKHHLAVVGQALQTVLLDNNNQRQVLFNVVAFGVTTQFLFPEGSRSLSDNDAMQTAKQYFDTLGTDDDMDFGRTDIVGALESIVQMTPVNPIHQRSILLLTDGDLVNTEATRLYNFVAARRNEFRLFSLGVGDRPNRAIINRLAIENGAGTSDIVFAQSNGTINVMDLIDALERQIRVVMTPTISVTNINWGNNNNTGMQAPFITPALFSGKRFTLFYIDDESSSLPSFVGLEGTIQGTDDVNATVEYQLESNEFNLLSSNFTTMSIIHQMAARELIRDLEQERSALHLSNMPTRDEIREEIIRLGVKYQIASSETSFVAIDNLGWTSLAERELQEEEEEQGDNNNQQRAVGGSFFRSSAKSFFNGMMGSLLMSIALTITVSWGF